MATATLPAVILSLAEDPAQQIVCYSADGGETDQVEGEVRAYGGRRRILLGDDDGRSITRQLRNLTLEQLTTLRTWRGLPVLFRDPHGRKVYGAFFAVEPTPHRDRVGWDVQLVITESTFDEEV